MDHVSMLVVGLVLITLIIAGAYVCTRRYEETDNNNPQPRVIDASQSSLVVLVKDHGGSVSIEIYGTNMQDIAYAAAELTAIACKNCSDGFEMGMQHIQQNAMNIASEHKT